jgi:hypothetical protein
MEYKNTKRELFQDKSALTVAPFRVQPTGAKIRSTSGARRLGHGLPPELTHWRRPCFGAPGLWPTFRSIGPVPEQEMNPWEKFLRTDGNHIRLVAFISSGMARHPEK